MKSIRFISAGAGSGKTYRLTQYLNEKLDNNEIRPEGVIATTFTNKAAAELVERVRRSLLENGKIEQSRNIGQALIGTVNGVCGRLLDRYAFEAGMSPDLQVMDEDETSVLFSQAIEQSVTLPDVRRLNYLAQLLSQAEWRKEVHSVISLARANNIDPGEFIDFANKSVDDLLSFFPTAINRDFTTELKNAVNEALTQLPAPEDSTKATRTYITLLNQVKINLGYNLLPWSDWVKLSKAAPAKRSLPYAESIVDIVGNFESHPQLHSDIKEWISSIFAIAAKTLETYQLFKMNRGLMDFVDQEKQVLDLLDQPEVQESLDQEIDLLMVDEFQDTSPIQLAIFLKLSRFADQTVWVGDVKQAIYGFRGSDPNLMNAVVDNLQNEGASFEVLPNSWRSRPSLVHFVNDLFVPAFSDILSPDKVKLEPALRDYDDPALEYWNLEGSNVGIRSGALASGIKTLLNEVRVVADKSSKRLRPLRPNDIALLCRTHNKAAACANALSENGVPVSLSKEGLLSTPEAYLGIACLRYMVDPTDTLAIAEIIVLSEAVSPEDWLEDRLEFLSKGLPSTKWGLEGRSSSRLIESLNSERKRLTVLSPVEALEAALQAGEVEKTVQLWGPVRERSMQRLANLEALRGYASEYEDYCLRQKSAATVAGFILWVNNLASEKLDKRGRDDKVAAVQVLTHHAAKGLEWPVVIAADLDTNIREGFWGANIFSETASFDFHNPLADRKINYWVKPFGQQAKGISVYDKIADSTLGQNDRERQLAESKRLLYVSFTRARDLLILPLNSKAKSHPWLDSLSAGWLTQENGTFELPSGNKIHCLARTLQASEFISPPDPADNFLWFSPKAGKEPFLPAIKTPSSFEAVSNAKIGEIIGFGSRVPLNGTPKMNQVGDAIHGCLAMEFSNTGTSAVIEDISRILERHGLKSQLDGDEILTNIVSFRKTLSEKLSPKSHYAEWPIQIIQGNGQIVRGWIDLVLETEDGWVIFDHKSFPGSLDEMKEKALSFSGQLQAYKTSIEAATNKPVLSLWINYMMTGNLIEVII